MGDTYPIRADGLRADFARDDLIPFLDVVATHDPATGRIAVFVLNRDLQAERQLVLDWRDAAPTRVVSCETITGSDLKACNTFEQPNAVIPRPLDAPLASATMTVVLPARSYTVLTLT